MPDHPRQQLALRAQVDIEKAVCDTVVEYDLTFAETAGILAQVLGAWAKQALKGERDG